MLATTEVQNDGTSCGRNGTSPPLLPDTNRWWRTQGESLCLDGVSCSVDGGCAADLAAATPEAEDTGPPATVITLLSNIYYPPFVSLARYPNPNPNPNLTLTLALALTLTLTLTLI